MVQACNELKIMPTTEGAEDLKMDLIEATSAMEYVLETLKSRGKAAI